MPSVLVVLAEGFEEIEVITPVDLMRRAGIDVTLAALAEGIHVTGRSQITMHAETTLAAVETAVFDGIFLPGGPGVSRLRADPRVVSLARRQADAGRLNAAICAAPLVLKDAGLLAGRRFTSHPSTSGELPERLGDERVVSDGQILTSRGAGTAVEFGLALVAQLVSPQKAAEVASAVAM